MVDNSKGAEPQFVSSLQAVLAAAGFEVDVRQPAPNALYDTSVHFVVEGVSIRVPDGFPADRLPAVVSAVREAEHRRGSDRRRTRAVPIYQGDTRRVLAWVDVFA